LKSDSVQGRPARCNKVGLVVMPANIPNGQSSDQDWGSAESISRRKAKAFRAELVAAQLPRLAERRALA
jgi:hypothetical protein